MDKLEKVKKGLKCCFTPQVKCRDCPYDCEGDVPYCTKALGNDALELLKEQKNLIDGLIEDQLKKDEEHTELLKEQQARLLTFDEVKDHYSVPVSRLQIEKYNDYAEDIKPLYFEFPDPDGWVQHWRGYDKVSAYLREWEKDYGRTWRCWTDKPTDEQRKAEPWEDGEQE